MARVATSLTVSDGSERWGLVEVYDAQGNVTRSFPITAAQLAAVKAGGVPPLLLRATWESGRAVVSGRPCLRGMCYIQPDGSLVINRGRRVVGQLIEQRFGNIAPGKWARVGGAIEVDADVVGEATVDASYLD